MTRKFWSSRFSLFFILSLSRINTHRMLFKKIIFNFKNLPLYAVSFTLKIYIAWYIQFLKEKKKKSATPENRKKIDHLARDFFFVNQRGLFSNLFLMYVTFLMQSPRSQSRTNLEIWSFRMSTRIRGKMRHWINPIIFGSNCMERDKHAAWIVRHCCGIIHLI